MEEVKVRKTKEEGEWEEKQKGDVKYWKETDKYKEIIFVRFIYNYASLEKINTIIEEALEKSSLIKELKNRGYKIEAKIEVIPRYPTNGDVQVLEVYVIFTANVKGLFFYYGSKFKQKVYIFTEDKVFKREYPPYPIKDDVRDWIGAIVDGDTIIEVR
ncbi:MAG: hypothetical protein QXY62_06295 [Candidatus Altiarchaeota archaeon]